MRKRFGVPRFLKITAHGATLTFAAFWLMATSAVPPPARDCYTGIAPKTTLRVALGPSANQRPAPSCGGIDGLASGGTLEISVAQGPIPASGCRGYPTQSIDGTKGVELVPGANVHDFDSFTTAVGTFTSPAGDGCLGQWNLTLKPREVPPIGQVISPLDAGPTQKWIVTRSIDEATAGACARYFGSLPDGQPAFCEDEFEVASISEASAAP